MDARSEATSYRVPALERGLRVLHLFNAYRTEISAAEAARDLRLPRASVYRIVKTLEFMGYLELVHGASYTLGPAALRIGSSFPHPGPAIRERADHVNPRPSPTQVHDGRPRETLVDVP